ncbi:MAG: aminotransferase class IV, partial [Solirubrobacterales bacterium]
MAAPILTSVDGRVLSPEDATISVADEGFVRGDGVFEMLRLYKGEPFAWDEHLDRLERSAAGVELPIDRDLVEREAQALLEAGGDHDGCLRIMLTRGGSRVLMLEPPVVHPATVTAATITFAPSVVLAGVKSLSYGANEQATRAASAKGAGEAVLVRPDGVVLEAPTSSIFWAADGGGLLTPSLELGILDSITRGLLVGELQVEEGTWPEEELHGAHEAFLASTTREVQPIASINGRELPAVPGPRTREAAEAYVKLTGFAPV